VLLGGVPTPVPGRQEAQRLPGRESRLTNVHRRVDEDCQIDEIGELGLGRVRAVEDDNHRGVASREISARRVRPIRANSGLEVEGMPLRRDAGE